MKVTPQLVNISIEIIDSAKKELGENLGGFSEFDLLVDQLSDRGFSFNLDTIRDILKEIRNRNTLENIPLKLGRQKMVRCTKLIQIQTGLDV